MTRRHVVASFYVHRPKEFPKAAPYLEMLRILDASCRRFGFDHVVLTDGLTSGSVSEAGMLPYFVNLPNSLMKSTTEVQARWLASPHSIGLDTTFVGADCIIRRDFRADLPACDLAIAYMKGHKRWRLNNGFMHVRAESRDRVAPLFRLIADDTGDEICDDMLAIERALVPMPNDYGAAERRGLAIEFLPLPVWNCCPKTAADPAPGANIMHFMGGWHALPSGQIVTEPKGKALFFDWAARHGFAPSTTQS